MECASLSSAKRQPASRARPRKLVVDVLPMPVAVQLDCDMQSCGLREDGIPVSRDTGTGVEHAPARVTEDGDTGRTHGGDHTGCLIVRFPQS